MRTCDARSDGGQWGGKMTTVGIIGLGKIGMPIAVSLIGAGHEVIGYRRSAPEDFERAGGKIGRSPADVGAQADIVLSCLPSEDALDHVVEGPDGLLRSARPGQIIAELGSHSLARKESHIAPFAAKGATFIDGEVSGTPGMIASRKGAIYLSGDEAACRRLEPLMRNVTDNVLVLGKFGTASKTKLINNMLVTIHIAAAAEAVALGIAAGLDPEVFINAVVSGSGGSTQFAVRAPWMAARRFLPAEGDPEGLIHYFGLISEFADSVGLSTPLLDKAAETFQRAIDAAFGKHDDAVLVDFANGVERP